MKPIERPTPAPIIAPIPTEKSEPHKMSARGIMSMNGHRSHAHSFAKWKVLGAPLGLADLPGRAAQVLAGWRA